MSQGRERGGGRGRAVHDPAPSRRDRSGRSSAVPGRPTPTPNPPTRTPNRTVPTRSGRTSSLPVTSVRTVPARAGEVNYGWSVVSDQNLKSVLQNLARSANTRVKVVSGNRSSVPRGGSRTSHHLQNRSADIHADEMTDKQLFEHLKQHRSSILIEIVDTR